MISQKTSQYLFCLVKECIGIDRVEKEIVGMEWWEWQGIRLWLGIALDYISERNGRKEKRNTNNITRMIYGMKIKIIEQY